MFRRERWISGRGGYRRADSGSAEMDTLQDLPHIGDPFHLFTDRRSPTTELRAQGHWDCVLQMGAAHLEHLVELPSLGEEGLLKLAQRFHIALQPEDQPEVKGRWIDVIC